MARPSPAPKRRSPRLPWFDYRQPRLYFVTFCTHRKRCTLSRIADGRVHLTPLGVIVDDALTALRRRHRWLGVWAHVVMPNHVHALLWLQPGPDGRAPRSLSAIVGEWKAKASSTARRRLGVSRIWQRSFHERIVRDEVQLQVYLAYIEGNPGSWEEDSLHRAY